MTTGHRFLDHMTDAEAEVWGETIEDALEEAGRATSNIMIDRAAVQNREYRYIKFSFESDHEMLYNWLEEIIFQTITMGFAISDAKVELSDSGLVGRLYGEPLDIKKHHFKVEAKAPTYHDMKIEKSSTKAFLRFLIDL